MGTLNCVKHQVPLKLWRTRQDGRHREHRFWKCPVCNLRIRTIHILEVPL